MRINVHAGHTSQNGKACGACGIVKESVEDRKIKDALIKILRERGHTVYDCTSEGSSASDNLRYRDANLQFGEQGEEVCREDRQENRRARLRRQRS